MKTTNIEHEVLQELTMKNNVTRLVCLTLVAALLATTASAQLFRSTSKVGTTAGQFLKIGVGARAIAMGGAQCAATNDITALYWNPAGLSRLTSDAEATFTHATWLADVNYDFAGGILAVGDFGTIGLSITLLGVPDDIVRTVEFPEGDGRVWDASSFAMGISYAKNLTDRFSIGCNVKYIRENVWSEAAQGFAVDFGTLYNSEIPGLTLGASISNFGTQMRLMGRDLYFNQDPDNNIGAGPNNIPSESRTEDFDLPLSFRIGIAYSGLRVDEFRLITAIDAVHPNDNTEYVNAGVEANWSEIVFARVGYKTLFMRDAEGGLTWGFGVQYGIAENLMIKVDYGFADYGVLKDVQYLTIGLKL
jgi:opacity protein-like surface antigen